jgi:hypothetical protein
MVFDAEFDAYKRGPDRASPVWRVTAGLAIAAGLAVVVVVWWAMATVANWNLPTPIAASEGVLPETLSAGVAAAKTADPVIEAKRFEAPATKAVPNEPSVYNWDSEFDRTAGMLVPPKDFAADGAATAFRAPAPRFAAPELGASIPALPPPPPVAAAPRSVAAESALEAALTPDKPALAMHEAIAGHRKAPAQEHEPLLAAAAKPHKAAGAGYYTEKLIEQGDAGAIKFRLVRRKCTPPNMVDVCFMPAENRRSILVQRW